MRISSVEVQHRPSVVDIVQHPLDLNRIFIAYEGGVALYSIREAEIEQTYTVLIPPGATGGGNDADMMVERRPNITCIAMRPDGLVLAAGTEECVRSSSAVAKLMNP